MKKIILISLLACAAIYLLWMRGDKDTVASNPSSVNVSMAQQSTQSNAASPSRPVVRQTEVIKNPIAVEFQETKSKFAFFEANKRSADPERRYMAIRAFKNCEETIGKTSKDAYLKEQIGFIPPDATNRPQRISVLSRIALECEGFVGRADIAQEADRMLIAALRGREFPLGVGLQVNDELNKPRPDSELVFSVFTKAIASGNPEAAYEGVGYLGGALAGGHLALGGRLFTPEDRIATAALDLVACEISQSCGAGSRMADLYCLTDGECASDYTQSMQRLTVTPAQFEDASALRDKILAAIRNGDRSFFTLKPLTKK